MNLVKLESIKKAYKMGAGSFQCLNGVSLSFERGEFTAIVGPSGSGKTTLLNIIGCIDTPTTGQVYIEGSNVANYKSNQLADLRAQTLGFIFQSFNLLPALTSKENTEYPLSNIPNISREERQKRVAHYIDRVGLSAHANHRPSQLSGGQKQRVAIARALVCKPKIILADEPTANLDHKTGSEILELMSEINKEEGVTFIFSTHDPKVMKLARREIHIEDGRIL